MAVTIPAFPLINGNYYSWASVEPVIGGITIPQRGMKELSYKMNLEPGVLYGAGSPRILGRTRGQWKPEASFTMYKIWFEYFLQSLGAGAMEATFNFVVHYREVYGAPLITDTILGCRMKSIDESYSDGTDGLVVKVDLSIIDVLKSGNSMMAADPALGTP